MFDNVGLLVDGELWSYGLRVVIVKGVVLKLILGLLFKEYSYAIFGVFCEWIYVFLLFFYFLDVFNKKIPRKTVLFSKSFT